MLVITEHDQDLSVFKLNLIIYTSHYYIYLVFLGHTWSLPNMNNTLILKYMIHLLIVSPCLLHLIFSSSYGNSCKYHHSTLLIFMPTIKRLLIVSHNVILMKLMKIDENHHNHMKIIENIKKTYNSL